ncbi:MAG: bifunctional nuclease family protein [Acidimicrobiales bacterium]
MAELEVVGVVARALSEEQRQRLGDQAEALAKGPGVAVVDIPAREHQVRLKERTGNRVLDICIGEAEAAAIAFGLQGDAMPRPMTHDFIGSVLGALDDVSVLRVVITKRENETFYAELELRHRKRVVGVDCRPSDGIAVAVRLDVPIIAADDLEPVFAAA